MRLMERLPVWLEKNRKQMVTLLFFLKLQPVLSKAWVKGVIGMRAG